MSSEATDPADAWQRRYMEMDVQRGNALVERDAAVGEVERLRAENERLTDWIRHLTEHHAVEIAEYTDTCDKVMDSLVATQRRERESIAVLVAEVERLRVERTVLDAARIQDVEIRNRVDVLVERLGQSEWIVCAEVLRYLGAAAALTDGTEATT